MPEVVRRPRPLLLGHRGARARKEIPENTLASFDQALDDGCDGFEFDVRLTADGVAVVCHDPQFGKIEIAGASGKRLSGLAQLNEVLSRYQDRAFLDIELKVAGIEERVVESSRSFPPQRGFVVSSFLPEVLRDVHRKDSSLPLGLICETRAELKRWDRLPVSFVIPHSGLVDPALIGRLKNSRKKILVWTVNDPAEMVRFRDLGVDGIISDDTSLLCRIIGPEWPHGD